MRDRESLARFDEILNSPTTGRCYILHKWKETAVSRNSEKPNGDKYQHNIAKYQRNGKYW